ncbi:MAG: DUF2460 domain-containing protein [Sphingomonadaceae bacterium]
MSFWLASHRSVQHHSAIQRFDPRFWTINFPRPMMASLVTTGPDSLRMDCEFHHASALAGLIWESKDRLDHPLLAYATNRDYTRGTLSFRWRSSGIIPLDEANGPTLTIEGRDAAGQPRVWYIRLWNYADGLPEDARITLAFSALESGFSLPGEPVWPGDIDRMFISLVPPAYDSGSTAPLPERADGRVELSDIRYDGEGAILDIGDVMLPPHGEQIATAYDDSFNQTPARLIRNARGLGYRGRILHYAGMSHYPRLERDGQGQFPVDQSATLCTPAEKWHASFFAQCAASGYEVITSLSYELLAEHCPDDWQQYAADGSPARTGWTPPSALLSPANPAPMAWLQAIAMQFTSLMEDAGLPVLFQIGEPWWWVNGNGGICLYDAAAQALFSGTAPVITNMRASLSPPQIAVLEQAGNVLAQSTADLSAAVRSAATGPAEILLLAFTPTILAPDMPELHRANLPAGWSFPAFDRLQLEDYDWLTAGADSTRLAALDAVNAKLSYPPDRQDYLAGFVLLPEDADQSWRRIDSALDEAASRGISQRFIWAMPQISRDGYTRLPSFTEQPMQAFDDISYPLALGRDVSVSPEFVTSVAVTASGHERRSTLWSDARLHYDIGPGVRSETELGILLAFYRARRGAARGFRLTDPFDHSSNGMTGAPTPLDQQIGVGDGLKSRFPLVKHYGEGAEPQIRHITRPHPESVQISVDGVTNAGWSLADGGMVTFAQAPAQGAIIRAGFLFDVPVRFAEDRLNISAAAFTAGEAPSVPVIEIREAV